MYIARAHEYVLKGMQCCSIELVLAQYGNFGFELQTSSFVPPILLHIHHQKYFMKLLGQFSQLSDTASCCTDGKLFQHSFLPNYI